MASHLITAARKGPKAGYDSLMKYLASPLGASNPRVAEVREAFEGLSAKRGLDLYCLMYFDGETPTVTPAASLAERRAVAARIAAKYEADIEDDKDKPSTRKKVANTKGDGSEPRTWNAYWVERKGLPTKVGAKFAYKSKKFKRTSKHVVLKVNRDGSIVTQRLSINGR